MQCFYFNLHLCSPYQQISHPYLYSCRCSNEKVCWGWCTADIWQQLSVAVWPLMTISTCGKVGCGCLRSLFSLHVKPLYSVITAELRLPTTFSSMLQNQYVPPWVDNFSSVLLFRCVVNTRCLLGFLQWDTRLQDWSSRDHVGTFNKSAELQISWVMRNKTLKTSAEANEGFIWRTVKSRGLEVKLLLFQIWH